MKGKYSKNNFVKDYLELIQTYFQSSESSIPGDVED